jgi:hypothetical protein
VNADQHAELRMMAEDPDPGYPRVHASDTTTKTGERPVEGGPSEYRRGDVVMDDDWAWWCHEGGGWWCRVEKEKAVPEEDLPGDLTVVASSRTFGAKGGPVVLRLLDEIAELRRGLGRVCDEQCADEDDFALARESGLVDPQRLYAPESHRNDDAVLAAATLARADAIGGGQ